MLKSVKKKLTDTKKSIQQEYSMPIELVVQQLDELINMVNGPFSSLDRMLKINAKEIKKHDVMSYAKSKAYMLGKYASSVLDSPSFFNPKWCNASYPDSRWKKEVDSIFENAKDSIEYILETGQDDVGIILGYYFDKLSLEGLDAFLNNVRKEEPKRQPETIFIDVNTGEILEQPEEQPAEETPSFTEPQINIVPESDIEEVDSEEDNADVKSQQPDEHSAEIEPVEVKVHRQVMLFGTKEQINKYLAAAPQFDVTVDDV